MSLPMLVNGADCGPINPLQGLAKTLDQDRGLQQDHFSAGRAGPSREAFRSEHAAASPGFAQDAAHFFSGNAAPPLRAGPAPYDVAALRDALPAPALSMAMNQQHIRQQRPAAAAGQPQVSWAADFLVQVPKAAAGPSLRVESARVDGPPGQVEQKLGVFTPPRQMYPAQMPMFSMNQVPQMRTQHTPQPVQLDQNLLERAFLSHEPMVQDQAHPARSEDADELARTAGLVVESVTHEQNPKFKNSQFLSLMRGLRDRTFKNSQFLSLMRGLRDRTVVVEGNDMVTSAPTSRAGAASDAKGKGRQMEPEVPLSRPLFVPRPPPSTLTTVPRAASPVAQSSRAAVEEDPNDAYFREDNEDYIAYWNARHAPHTASGQASHSGAVAEWEHLQEDWDAFEASTTGVRPVSVYTFQSGNPYLVGDRTRTHTLHGGEQRPQSFFESVLQLEATVQSEPTNSRAWYELGVKQQENEREKQAIQALRRAIKLDPAHLPSWLALAISQTNEGNRQGTYDALREWIGRNDRYRPAVDAYSAGAGGIDSFEALIGCLIAMARSEAGGEVDADIQIALAVLLNTNEDYAKAQDCFRAALSVRPEDWLLYNRVGATLANSGQAEQAISYYYRALEINPAYIRARFNLGISCINLRRYDEAAQHILDALVLQDSDRVRGSNDTRGVISTALWDSLKTTCLHMQRIDLAAMCDRQDLEGIRVQLA
ncbi:TPR-like protein [Auriscalpium vulgare]|uniref:TPR-like protein n=1 Tax=Auriscalpium vulgare TaxID=40419 RepID=A0ACB8R7X2_9AGAM|nr:TPR-like protein [Auriscalpium vulgare]